MVPPRRVSSLNDSLEIKYGLTYSPKLLQPSPGLAIAALLHVSVEDVEAFPEWRELGAAHGVYEPAVAKRSAAQQAGESEKEARQRTDT